MTFKKEVFYLFLCVLFSEMVSGKEYPMLHYTTENGLPSNTVYDVCKDRQGNLWFATDKGVAIFDGLIFRVFTTYDGLSDNEVFSICEDYSGRLWMNTYSGKICYYKGGRFYSEANAPFLHYPLKAAVGERINLEKDSSITYTFIDPTFFINIKNDKLSYHSLLKINKLYANSAITNVSKIDANTFEISYSNETVYIDSNQNVKKSTAVSNVQRYNAFLDKNLYATEDKVYDSNKVVKNLPYYFWHNRVIHHIYKTPENIFISTSNGLFINDSLELLNKMSIAHVKQDGNGNYIVCTLNNGFFVLNRSFKSTQYYSNVYNGVAKYAMKENGKLYIGTHNKSLFKLENDKSMCVFNSSSYVDLKTISPTSKNGYLIVDNNYFVFGQSKNLIVTNIDKKPIVKWFWSKKVVAIDDIFFVKPLVYLTSRGGVSFIDYKKFLHPSSLDFQTVFYYKTDNDRIFSKSISDNSDLWCSKGNAMYRLINDTSVIQPQFKGITFREFVISGNFMVGYTHSNNLLICENFRSNIVIDSVSTEKCVWDKIYKLDSNQILISTNNLYRIITLDNKKGKPGYRIQTLDNPFIPLQAEHIYSDGEICYFFKNGDVTAIQLKELIRKAPVPTVTFTSFNTKEKEYCLDSFINLKYSEAKHIIMTFAIPSFYKNIYSEYAILKDNETVLWLPALGRDISLYNLSYGNYRLLLRAKSESGEYSSPVMLALSVEKPFWVTWWFITICTIFILLVLRYRFKLALSKKEKVHEREIKFLRLEYKALNALMNPHFIFNAINSMQSLINTDNKTSASEYLRTFSDLIRQNMHNMSAEFISLEQEINLVRNYLKLEKLRFDNYLSYEIHISEDIELDDVLIPPLLIQPLVENAVKHGLFHKQSIDNLIIIRIYTTDKLIHIEVEDNGVGLSGIKKRGTDGHKSYGIENIQRRIAKLALMQSQHMSFEITELRNENGLILGTKAVVSLQMIAYP